MQFVLMIYHTPEEFDMRKRDYTDPHLGAWRAYYKALVARPLSQIVHKPQPFCRHFGLDTKIRVW